MQSHKEVWFSVSDQEEFIHFRGYHVPHPLLEFIPWPIKVQGIYFDDGTSLFTANPNFPPGPTLIAGPGITFTYGVGTITIAASPWTTDINANSFSLFNLANLNAGNAFLSGNLTTDGNLEIGGPLSEFSGSVNVFGVMQAGRMNVLAGGNYSLNGIEFALQSGGQVNLQNIGNINGQTYPPPAGQFQTPWLQPINAAQFELYNVSVLTGPSAGPAIYLSGNMITLSGADDPSFPQVPSIIINGGARGVRVATSNSFPNANILLSSGGYTQINAYSGNLSLLGIPAIVMNPMVAIGYVATQPAYALDVNGDINTTGAYRINSIPFAIQSGDGIALQNIESINGDPVDFAAEIDDLRSRVEALESA